MTPETSDPLAQGLRALAGFALAQGVIVGIAVQVMQRVVWTDPLAAASVRASGWLAFVVQLFTFAIARLVARQQVIAAWGLGVLLRFATVGFWAWLGIRALGLDPTPALMSLVVCYFLSTLVEPLFLS
ncbi:MAG: hypothetical protein RLZZ621_582 [Gemmatimonadota bacterium]|jgi:hypothetical protein